MVKAAIFDLDNTLYDFDSLELAAYGQVAALLADKRDVSERIFFNALASAKQRVKNQLGDVASSHSRLLYFQAALEDMDLFNAKLVIEMSDAFWTYVLVRIIPFQGVIDLFDTLKREDVKIAICTDLAADIQMRKISCLGINHYIDVLVTSEEAGVEKPNPRILQLCLKKLNINPQECIFVGDSYGKDILGAEALGISAILAVNGFPSEEIMRRIYLESTGG
jgi:putative hydrolase of the HAD superfamily